MIHYPSSYYKTEAAIKKPAPKPVEHRAVIQPKAKNPLNQLRGAMSRASGEIFEKLIDAACAYYDTNSIAVIEKTPEPFKVTRNLGYGQFIGHFEKQAQPDYKGVLSYPFGTAIAFECKHTEADIIEQSRLTDTQTDGLNKYCCLGAQCFVLVSYRFERFYRVPWEVWCDMKQLYGRKYMTLEELKQFQVPFASGIIKFLD